MISAIQRVCVMSDSTVITIMENYLLTTEGEEDYMNSEKEMMESGYQYR